MSSQTKGVSGLKHIDAFRRTAQRRRVTTPDGSSSVTPNLSSASKSSGKSISRLDTDVALQVRSAHVVLDTAAIIKELIENSLDAGASSVDVKIRGKAGLDRIVISDNGAGIGSKDHSFLCMAGSTSKLRKFTDIDAVTTFGFRGEALSAICALTNSMSVITRTKEAVMATHLQFRSDGSLLHRKSVARPVGTTVIVEGLFMNLPVRRKDAMKNAAREVAKAVAVVQSLALISVTARIELRVSNELKVLSKPILTTGAKGSPLSSKVGLDLSALRVTAGSIIGTRTARALMEVYLAPNQKVGTKYGFSGLVSGAALDAKGSGGRARSTHQYVYANRRPVDLPRLVKSATEAYRRCTGMAGASPVLILNVELPEMSADVNLAPDKRALFVRDEDGLIESIVERLEELWAPKEIAPIPLREIEFYFDGKGQKSSNEQSMSSKQITRDDRDHHGASTSNEDSNESGQSLVKMGTTDSTCKNAETRAANLPVPPPGNDSGRTEEEARSLELGKGSTKVSIREPATPHPEAVDVILDGDNMSAKVGKVTVIRGESFPEPLLDCKEGTNGSEACKQFTESTEPEEWIKGRSKHNSEQLQEENRNIRAQMSKQQMKLSKLTRSLGSAKRDVTSFIAQRSAILSSPLKRPRHNKSTSSAAEDSIEDASHAVSGGDLSGANSWEKGKDKTSQPAVQAFARVVQIDSPITNTDRREVGFKCVVAVDWNAVCDYTQGKALPEKVKSVSGFRDSSLTEPNAVSECPTNAHAAEQEISRLFHQEWFLELSVLGQFNRGFIICRLGADLFIIDQHASDEKYNFEDLQKNSVISRQTLVRPLALEFSAQDELLILQHLEAFKAGGFDIEYRGHKKPTKRLYLISQPVSKNTMFVQDDLQDIVASLKTSPTYSSRQKVNVLRPSRVRAMFASRACRKSIMIGTALKRAQMQRVVRNLAKIEHPWTCPHGRPTMRHLCVLPDLVTPS